MAKKSAGDTAIRLAVVGGGAIAAFMFLPGLVKKVSAASRPASPSMAGGQSSSPLSSLLKPSTSQPSTGSMPGMGGSQAMNPNRAATPAGSANGSFLESIANALRLGNTRIDPYVLAATYNMQTTGNPFGDTMSQIMSDFGFASDVTSGGLEDPGIMAENSYGIDSVAGPSLFDFGSWGTSSDPYSGYDTGVGGGYDYGSSGLDYSYSSYDTGYIDPYSTSTYDFGSYGVDPSSYDTYAVDTGGGADYQPEFAY